MRVSVLPFIVGLFLVLLAPLQSGAWTITNETNRTYDGWAFLPGLLPLLPFSVGPNSQFICDWNLPNCNPQKPTLDTNNLIVKLTDDDGRTFECQVRMEAGGKVHIREQSRSLAPGGLPEVANNFYCASMLGGAYVDSSDPFAGVLQENNVPAMTDGNRHVKFLAAGDPQYNNAEIDGDGNTSGDAADADAMLAELVNLLGADDDYRGVIVNGDLTQNARGDNDGFPLEEVSDELDAYRWAIEPEARRFFEGLGNHDVEDTGGSSAVGDMREFVHEKPRSTIRTFSGTTGSGTDPHYSWDWHNVHFVQLNVMAADEPSDDYPGLDPRDALTWLAADLQSMVGNTGRPVILNHHYGFDDFSTDGGWWTGAQRAAYWNVLRDYNVIAIFSGHDHSGSGADPSEWVNLFGRPSLGESAPVIAIPRPDGRGCIPNFNGSAIRSSAALEVEIDGVDVKVQRRGTSGIVSDSLIHYDLSTMNSLSFSDSEVMIPCPEPGSAASVASGLALLCMFAGRRIRS